MLEPAFRIFEHLMGAENNAIRAIGFLAVLALFAALKTTVYKRGGELLGGALGALVNVMKPGIVGIAAFLALCLAYALIVPTQAKAATRYGAIEVGIQLICAVVARGDHDCVTRLLYDGERYAPRPFSHPINRGWPLARGPDNRAPAGLPDTTNEEELLMPTVILPEEPEVTRRDVDEHPELFGLPVVSDQDQPEDAIPVGPPADLLPEALRYQPGMAPRS